MIHVVHDSEKNYCDSVSYEERAGLLPKEKNYSFCIRFNSRELIWVLMIQIVILRYCHLQSAESICGFIQFFSLDFVKKINSHILKVKKIKKQTNKQTKKPK